MIGNLPTTSSKAVATEPNAMTRVATLSRGGTVHLHQVHISTDSTFLVLDFQFILSSIVLHSVKLACKFATHASLYQRHFNKYRLCNLK
jgi:hypothetical protein